MAQNHTLGGLSYDDLSRITTWLTTKTWRQIPHVPYEDLHQDAWVAALQAIKSYDPEKGTRVSSWVVTVVIGTLKCRVAEEISKHQRFRTVSYEVEVDRDYSDDSSEKREFLAILSSLLSPLAQKVVHTQVSNYPKRVKKSLICSIVGIGERDLENLYLEIKNAVQIIRGEDAWDRNDASESSCLTQKNAQHVATILNV